MTPLERLEYRLNRAGDHGYVTMSVADLRAIHASGIEARRAANAEGGAVEDESPPGRPKGASQ